MEVFMFTQIANRRFTLWTAGCWTLFVALVALASATGPNSVGSGGSIVLSLAIAVPIGLHVAATLALIESADEFARMITLRRFVVAWGVSAALFCAWGFMEQYAGATHAPPWAIYPLFWGMFALVSLVVRSSR
jgi:hypothetical protein